MVEPQGSHWLSYTVPIISDEVGGKKRKKKNLKKKKKIALRGVEGHQDTRTRCLLCFWHAGRGSALAKAASLFLFFCFSVVFEGSVKGYGMDRCGLDGEVSLSSREFAAGLDGWFAGRYIELNDTICS